MKLIRNTTPDGRCKYALVRLDKIRLDEQEAGSPDPTVIAALKLLENRGLLEYGEKGSEEEFFVVKLKDVNAAPALAAYATSAFDGDAELSEDVCELAERSKNHPNRRRPD